MDPQLRADVRGVLVRSRLWIERELRDDDGNAIEPSHQLLEDLASALDDLDAAPEGDAVERGARGIRRQHEEGCDEDWSAMARAALAALAERKHLTGATIDAPDADTVERVADVLMDTYYAHRKQLSVWSEMARAALAAMVERPVLHGKPCGLSAEIDELQAEVPPRWGRETG
jgi:hypothetical protein